MNKPTSADPGSWIALDIGGANIKVAHGSGVGRTDPSEVWERPDELSLAVAGAVATLPSWNQAAVTMTAEPLRLLSDQGRRCERRAGRGGCGWCPGVRSSCGESTAGFTASPRSAGSPDARRGGQLAGTGDRRRAIDTAFHGNLDRHRHDHDRPHPARLRQRGGPRTKRYRAAPERRSWCTRECGERPCVRSRPELPVRGVPTGLAAEMFPSTLDVYLMLGDLEPDPADLSTADGRPATREAARDRLARMVGTDREGLSADDAFQFARAADRCLMARLERAAERACRQTIGQPEAAVIAGSGDFLAPGSRRAWSKPAPPSSV